MSTANYTNPTYWFSKFFECLFAFIILAEVFFTLPDTLLAWFYKDHPLLSSDNLLLTYLYIVIVIAIGLSVWWQLKEKKPNFRSAAKHAWLQSIMRYFLAYEISVYGFAKILKTQFAPLYVRSDTPVGNLSGFELTWNYFGYSHTFAVILGLIQIGGSFMLLFKQTRLLALFILLPVMVNIILINIFYNITTGAFIMSLILTAGLLYLLLLRWQDIKALFFRHPIEIPQTIVEYIKPLLKVFTIAAAFFTIYSYVWDTPAPSILTGKWKVQQFKRNGKQVDLKKWQDSTGLWENIYIVEGGQLMLSSNPYIFDPASAVTANYDYDRQKHKFIILLNGIMNKTDTEVMAVSNYNGKSMQWNRIFNGDTVQYKLAKVTPIYSK